MPADHDLLVVGAGPAGRALSVRAARAGLDTVLVDPAPERAWQATYGAWTDELPDWLDADCVAASAPHAVVYTPARRIVERGYCVLDTPALQRALTARVPVVGARARTVGAQSVTVESGETLTATTVVDARGGVVRPGVPRQTAVGVRRPTATPEMVVMDWRPVSDAATFSYRVALGGALTLAEETCLAGAPPVGLNRLAELAALREGSAVDLAGPDVERVDFGLLPAASPPWRRRGDEPLRFGATGGQMHPATGYSVAASLAAADIVVDALAARLDPHAALWPPAARAVYDLRAAGLGAILRMSGTELTAFFDVFFALPVDLQRAYLSARTDVAGVGRAMWRVFAALDAGARLRLVRGFGAGALGRASARMTR